MSSINDGLICFNTLCERCLKAVMVVAPTFDDITTTDDDGVRIRCSSCRKINYTEHYEVVGDE